MAAAILNRNLMSLKKLEQKSLNKNNTLWCQAVKVLPNSPYCPISKVWNNSGWKYYD